jgi:transcriptional regulator with XRE-family HTH domain
MRRKMNKSVQTDERKSSSLDSAIRELRVQLGLSQFQFASELGITPTSIYRYEAGTSVPNAEVLTRLLQNAVSHQLFDVARHFASAWSDRTGLTFSVEASQTGMNNPLLQAVSRLRPDQQLAVMSFVQMLEHSTDQTTDRMIKVLLEPWLERAKQEFGPVDVAFKLGDNFVVRDTQTQSRADRDQSGTRHEQQQSPVSRRARKKKSP